MILPIPVVVNTAADLQAAVKAGKPHVEIQDHIDLTTLDILTSEDYLDTLLGRPPPTMKSIRVWYL